MADDARFIEDLVAVIRRHYSDGIMPIDDIVACLGTTIVAAVASLPEADRDRVARFLAHEIRNPPKSFKGAVPVPRKGK